MDELLRQGIKVVLSGTKLIEKCKEKLEDIWEEVQDDYENNSGDYIEDENMLFAIKRSINSASKSYRYVLPTQLLSKFVEPELDCRCLQAARGGTSAFDARSIAHKVIVPFDRQNNMVLGGSPEPYVNNPLRYPEISKEYRDKQKNKKGWDDLYLVLNTIQEKNDKYLTEKALKQTFREILRRLEVTRVTYPVPARISLTQAVKLIEDFISISSGGDRVQAIVTALIKAIGKEFNLFDDIKRASINAADASTGMVSDIECYLEGELVLAIEVKDTELTLTHINSKLPNFKERYVTEILFIITKGILEDDKSKIYDLVEKEFISGHNIYILDLLNFSHNTLALLGEKGRRIFLDEVGHTLEEFRSNIVHRKAWAELLSNI